MGELAAGIIPGMMTTSLEAQVGALLTERRLTIALAESCTGGLLAHRLTNIPGSSVYFIGGVVTYAYEAKVSMLGVTWATLQAHGAVSAETVREMARGVRQVYATDIGLAISGIAGPGGATPEKPVGLAWIGLSAGAEDRAWQTLTGLANRLENKTGFADAALQGLLSFLLAPGGSAPAQ